MIRVIMIHDLTNQLTMTQTVTKTNTNTNTNTDTMTETWRGVWNCLHFRQLRTWLQDNHCDLTIKSDTLQHSQFLRCFFFFSWFFVLYLVNCELAGDVANWSALFPADLSSFISLFLFSLLIIVFLSFHLHYVVSPSSSIPAFCLF